MENTRRALLSVSDKTGLVEFAKTLRALGFEIVSTGGTRKHLSAAEVPSLDISEISGNKEAFGGRLKSLSFNILAAILFDRDKNAAEAFSLDLKPIDLVVVNFYPFAEAIKTNPQKSNPVEHIDIGGPCLVRAAAKNHAWVTVVTSPSDYENVLEELQNEKGATSYATRRTLAQKAFALCANYDSTIATYYAQEGAQEEEGNKDNMSSSDKIYKTHEPKTSLPNEFSFTWKRHRELRYGENPHEPAALYLRQGAEIPFQVHGGKELSYNNIVDMFAAFELATELPLSSVVIVKHNNPCGAACHLNTKILLEEAWACDPVSAFGSIIACNFKLTKEDLHFLNFSSPMKNDHKFIEIIAAPDFSESALEYLQLAKNLRIVSMRENKQTSHYKSHIEGDLLLLQEKSALLKKNPQSPTLKKFPLSECEDLVDFGLTLVRKIKSNAIAIVEKTPSGSLALLGMGAGQPNRLIATKLAIDKARENLTRVCGSEGEICDRMRKAVLISDAFFPFADTIFLCAKAGITLIAEPSGSLRDAQVVEACNSQSIALLFTNIRHFNH